MTAGQAKSETLQIGEISEEQKVPLKDLSDLTGFPVEFIKSELLLSDEELSMKELRQSMMTYLESTSETFCQTNT